MSAVVDSPVAHDLGQSLLRAAAEDDRAKVENLLLRGIPVDVIDDRSSAEGIKRTGLTCLHWACRNGSIMLIKRLIVAGASLDKEDSWGRRALAHAGECGHAQCVRLLCEQKQTKIDALDHGGWSALARACKNCHRDVVIELLAAGAKPSRLEMKAALASNNQDVIEMVGRKMRATMVDDNRDDNSEPDVYIPRPLEQHYNTMSPMADSPHLEECLRRGTFSDIYRCRRSGRPCALRIMKPFQSFRGSVDSDLRRGQQVLREVIVSRVGAECQNMIALDRTEFWKFNEEVEIARRHYDISKDISEAARYGGPNLYDKNGNSIFRKAGAPEWWWYTLCQYELATTSLEKQIRSSFKRVTLFSSRRERKAVAFQILSGLKYMHEILGVVHRNIQPSCILCFTGNPSTRYKLCDFRNVAPIGSERPRLMESGLLPYQPPELVQFEQNQSLNCTVSVSHDLWALGAVLNELLGGCVMIPADSVSRYAQLYSELKMLPPRSGKDPLKRGTYRVPYGASRSYGEADFFSTMLNDDVGSRPPDARAALALSWLNQVAPQAPVSPLSPNDNKIADAIKSSRSNSADDSDAAVRLAPRGVNSDSSTIEPRDEVAFDLSTSTVVKTFKADLKAIDSAKDVDAVMRLLEHHVSRRTPPVSLVLERVRPQVLPPESLETETNKASMLSAPVFLSDAAPATEEVDARNSRERARIPMLPD